jgi:hypothetical protein
MTTAARSKTRIGEEGAVGAFLFYVCGTVQRKLAVFGQVRAEDERGEYDLESFCFQGQDVVKARGCNLL